MDIEDDSDDSEFALVRRATDNSADGLAFMHLDPTAGQDAGSTGLGWEQRHTQMNNEERANSDAVGKPPLLKIKF